MAEQLKSRETAEAIANPRNEQPLNRRRALRVLSVLAAGAAALSATGSKEASADGTEGSTSFTGPITATSSYIAVFGDSSDSTGGAGVYGQGVTTGVIGLNNGNGDGVRGVSSAGPGVFGHNTGGGNGVYGANSTPAGGQAAILGYNDGGGPGVVGFSGGSTSLAGGTGNGTGLAGIASITGTGVAGASAGGTAVSGIAQGTTNLAGLFQGPVWITGGLSVQGGKSGVVKGADGSLRRLYCVESPESWFEDFGRGQLNNGSATVQLEPGFAGVVKTDQYHVFPIPKGDCKGLYVSNQTPAGFIVRESQGGTSSVAFDYRVIAKRKDIEGARLELVTELPMPALPRLSEPPPTPPGPQAPKPPERGG
jgi:hypothetical protein